MGETGKEALRVGFDRTITLALHGARVSSDAGLFPDCELDDAAGLTELAAAELFPRVGLIVTILGSGAKPVVDFYNRRGTAEQWIKEGKQAVR